MPRIADAQLRRRSLARDAAQWSPEAIAVTYERLCHAALAGLPGARTTTLAMGLAIIDLAQDAATTGLVQDALDAARDAGFITRVLLEPAPARLAPPRHHRFEPSPVAARSLARVASPTFRWPRLSPQDEPSQSPGSRRRWLCERNGWTELLARPRPQLIRRAVHYPWVQEQDLIRLAAARPIQPEIAQIIVASRWIHRAGVRNALFMNPTAPLEASLPLLPVAWTCTLEELSRGRAATAALSHAALLLLGLRGQGVS